MYNINFIIGDALYNLKSFHLCMLINIFHFLNVSLLFRNKFKCCYNEYFKANTGKCSGMYACTVGR